MDVKETLLDSISNLIDRDKINIVFIDTINNYNTEQSRTEQSRTEQRGIEYSNNYTTRIHNNNTENTNHAVNNRREYSSSILNNNTQPAIYQSSYLTPIPPAPLPPMPLPLAPLSQMPLPTIPLPTIPLPRTPLYSSNPLYSSTINRDNRTTRSLFTSISNVNMPYYRRVASNVIYREETKEETKEEKEEEYGEKEEEYGEKEEDSDDREGEREDYDYADMPELISLRDETENNIENNSNVGNVGNVGNDRNSSNQTYLESASLHNIQNMIDSILGSIPNIPGELSIEFPINNRVPMEQPLNSIESINNQSYLIPVNEANKETYIHEECSICNINYREGDIIRKFDRCPHFFHYKCIDRWLNTHKNCPVCTVNII